MAKSPTLATSARNPIADIQNSVTAGPRGPVLMQDFGEGVAKALGVKISTIAAE